MYEVHATLKAMNKSHLLYIVGELSDLNDLHDIWVTKDSDSSDDTIRPVSINTNQQVGE